MQAGGKVVTLVHRMGIQILTRRKMGVVTECKEFWLPDGEKPKGVGTSGEDDESKWQEGDGRWYVGKETEKG